MPLLTEIPRLNWTNEMYLYDAAIERNGKTDLPFPEGVYGHIEEDHYMEYYMIYFVMPKDSFFEPLTGII